MYQWFYPPARQLDDLFTLSDDQLELARNLMLKTLSLNVHNLRLEKEIGLVNKELGNRKGGSTKDGKVSGDLPDR